MSVPLDAVMDTVEWTATGVTSEGDMPHATHTGVMDLFGHKLRCYRLSDGRAIFDADDFLAFLDNWGNA